MSNLQLALQYPAPAPLLQALNQQQGVAPIRPLRGQDALAFTVWKRSVLAHVKQRYRAGNLSPARMEVVLPGPVARTQLGDAC